MRSITLLALVPIVLLTGCSSLPTCGTSEGAAALRQGGACTHGLLGTLADSGIQPQPSRNYTTNPITLQPAPQMLQPNFKLQPGEQYQTITMNTPNGLVYKRCKVLNGQVVACF